MKSTTVVSALFTGVTALKVVQFDTYRTERPRLARRDTVDAGLDNLVSVGQYNINVTVGTPPQPISVQLDTGSSDLWFNTPGSAYCSAADSTCFGGTFNTSASSTYQVALAGAFEINYFDNTGASGDYGRDTVQVGNASLIHQVIGVANVSNNIDSGLMGVSFPLDEAVCNEYADRAACPAYPGVLAQLVAQGYINTAAYSLWLNDLSAATGSILFGGIDKSKYHGDLVAMPIIPNPRHSNATSNVYTDMNVYLSDVTVTGIDNVWTASDETVVVLDSGTSLTYVPQDVFQAISTGLSATKNNDTGTIYVDCAYREKDITFNFTFGGPYGPKIAVGISEFVLPQRNNATYPDGTPACRLGIRGQDGGPYLFGDTFLRSAYVVYDQYNKEIAIAQTNFNGGEPDIVEIGATYDIPSVTSTDLYSAPAAATSAAANGTAIGPVTASQTASGTLSATPAIYTGAGTALKVGGGQALMGCLGIVLAGFATL